jgi:hypothetical protein
LNAIKSFELIDKLKLMRNELARPEGYESFSCLSSSSSSSRIEEIKKLCVDLKSSVEFVTNKKCIHLIKRRVNKKKNKKTTSNSLFYHSELENLLRNKELFWENDSLSSTNKNANSINLFDSFVSNLFFCYCCLKIAKKKKTLIEFKFKAAASKKKSNQQ